MLVINPTLTLENGFYAFRRRRARRAGLEGGCVQHEDTGSGCEELERRATAVTMG